MPKVNDYINSNMTRWFGPSWRSTIDGFMSFVAVNSTLLTSYLAVVAQAHPQQGWFWVKVTTAFAMLSATAKWYIGHITIDAGTKDAAVEEGRAIEGVIAASKQMAGSTPVTTKQSGV